MLGVGVFKSGMCRRAVCWAFWVPFHATAWFFLFLLLSTHQLLHIHIPFFFFFQLSGMLSPAKCLRGFMRGICPCGGVPPLPPSNSSRLCCRQVPQEDVPSAVCYQNMNLASIMGGKKIYFWKMNRWIAHTTCPSQYPTQQFLIGNQAVVRAVWFWKERTVKIILGDCENAAPLAVSFWRMILYLITLSMLTC